MKTQKLASTLSVLVVVIALMHIVAMKYNLYFSVWWFDILLHFLGGLWCALFVLFYVLVFRLRKRIPTSNGHILLVGIGSAFFIGALWELYEFVFDYVFTTKGGYPLDTVLDFVMDIGGGIIASAYVIRVRLGQLS